MRKWKGRGKVDEEGFENILKLEQSLEQFKPYNPLNQD
jgi:hypothetical protein